MKDMKETVYLSIESDPSNPVWQLAVHNSCVTDMIHFRERGGPLVVARGGTCHDSGVKTRQWWPDNTTERS